MGEEKKRSALEVAFIICNVIFLFGGIFLFGVGVYFQISRSDFLEVLDSEIFQRATALLVSAGIIVITLSVFGIGMFSLRHVLIGLLSIYAAIMFLLIVLQCVAGGLALTMYNQISSDLEVDMRNGLKDPDRKTAWDNVQGLYQCCGIHNASDWLGIHDKVKPSTIPDSCCGYDNCGQTGVSTAYTIGCFDDAEEWLEMNYIWIAVVGIAVAVLQLFLLIAPTVMICKRVYQTGCVCCQTREPEYQPSLGYNRSQYSGTHYNDSMYGQPKLT